MRLWKLIILLLLWQQSFASTCNSAFSIPGHVLLDHVIQSFTGTSSADSCFDKCEANSSCHSINWYSNTGLCQLNKGTHLSYPEGLVASELSASYKLYSLHPMVTCSNRFCSDADDICLMNNDGINYRCESELILLYRWFTVLHHPFFQPINYIEGKNKGKGDMLLSPLRPSPSPKSASYVYWREEQK